MQCLDRLRSVARKDRPVPVAVAHARQAAAGPARRAGHRRRLEGVEACERFFARQPAPGRSALAQWLLEQSREQLRVDFHRSLACAQSALPRSPNASATSDSARLSPARRRPTRCRSAATIRRSIEQHTQAIAAFERVGDEPGAGAHAQRLHAAAAPARPLRRGARGRRSGATAVRRAGRRSSGSRGWTTRSATCSTARIGSPRRWSATSAPTRRSMPLGDADGVLSVIHNKAVTLTSLNNFREALAAYEEARRLAVESRPRSGRRAGRLQHRVALLPARRIQPRDRDPSHRGARRRSGPATPITPPCRSSISRRSISS